MDDFEREELELYKFRESLRNRMLALEDIGWSPVDNVSDDDGPDLDTLKNLAPKLREMASTNPWHIRGAQLRHSYVFGRNVSYSNTEKISKVLEDAQNKAALFSVDAYEMANLALFTDGNFFVIRIGDKQNSKFQVMPMRQVTAVSTNPDDETDIWYIQRTWTSNDKQKVRWYPVSRYKKSRGVRIRKTLDRQEVAQDAVIYYRTTKRQTGWTWGIPDSLGAMTWTTTYSEYLRDEAILVKALSQIAWKYTASSAKSASNAAVEVRNNGGGVGATATMAPGSQLQGVGVPSAQVNMGNGQPLISAVATSFGVPVIALLSSPGETGGSYGAATSLDAPTLKGMMAVQNAWGDFYEEILRDVGAKDAKMEFPAIETDPIYRQVGSLAQAAASGLLWRDEARDAVLDILDVDKLHDFVPKPDGFNSYTDPDPDEPEPTDPVNPVASQGNSGAVGSLTQGDTNHDNDE